MTNAVGRVRKQPLPPPLMAVARPPYRAARSLLRLGWHAATSPQGPVVRGLKAVHTLIGRPLSPRLGTLRQYAPRPLRLPPPVPVPPAGPRISLVTPSYNQGEFLERTLCSVLGQGYPRLEYLVQDGGSDDETPGVLQRYRGALARCESVRDRGQADALNRAFRHATGEVLAWLNSDDLLLPGSLAYVADFFARYPEVDVVYGHRVVIDEDDREVGRWLLPPHDDAVLSWADYVPQETLFWRRGIWEKTGARLDEDFHFALDWDLLLRFRDAGARFVRLPRFLGAFRAHARQKTQVWLKGVGGREMARLRRRCLGREARPEEIARRVRPYMRRHVVARLLAACGLAEAA
jgi:glycosyltransferase involved in cell wall biosynthesis